MFQNNPRQLVDDREIIDLLDAFIHDLTCSGRVGGLCPDDRVCIDLDDRNDPLRDRGAFLLIRTGGPGRFSGQRRFIQKSPAKIGDDAHREKHRSVILHRKVSDVKRRAAGLSHLGLDRLLGDGFVQRLKHRHLGFDLDRTGGDGEPP